jgi:hypothetical protein
MAPVTSAANNNNNKMSDFRESIITSDLTSLIPHTAITINQKKLVAKSFPSKAPTFKLIYSSSIGLCSTILVSID